MALTLATSLALLFAQAAAAAPSLAQQSPVIADCTAKSFTIPSWFVEDLRIEPGKVSFGLVNRATNLSLPLACELQAGDGGSEWTACAPSGESEDPSLEASVRVVDAELANVRVKQSWTCNDRDPSKP